MRIKKAIKNDGLFRLNWLVYFYYTIPCANMASATFTKPAMLAPLT